MKPAVQQPQVVAYIGCRKVSLSRIDFSHGPRDRYADHDLALRSGDTDGNAAKRRKDCIREWHCGDPEVLKGWFRPLASVAPILHRRTHPRSTRSVWARSGHAAVRRARELAASGIPSLPALCRHSDLARRTTVATPFGITESLKAVGPKLPLITTGAQVFKAPGHPQSAR